MTPSVHDLSDIQLATLNALAEVVTPETPGFPSAEDADPGGAVLAMALSHFGHFIDQVRDYLDRVATDPVLARDLERLEALDPDEFAIVCDLLVSRYLTCRPVWRLLGYPGRVPALPSAGEVEFYLRDDLLEPVIARGPIYTLPPL